MKLDEQTLVDALHGIDGVVPVDLANRVRAGGRRRVARRRAYAAVGVIALLAVVTPVVLTLRAGNKAKVEPAGQHVYPGLYAPPPPPGSKCAAGRGAGASPTDDADLLLLPPAGQPAEALLRQEALNCLNPHVALTALRVSGGVVASGLVVDGPNAPTPEEVNLAGAGVHFGGQVGHLPVHGRAASEYTFPGGVHTDAYWTEPDGGQWRATVSGMSQARAVELLNRIVLDSHDGTAALTGAAKDGWTIESAARDVAPTDVGQLSAGWTDPQGHRVEMTVLQGPDRVYQLAAGAPAGPYGIEGYDGPLQLVTVRDGKPAALGIEKTALIFWQEAPDVEVLMTIDRADETEIEQVADALQLAEPSDPRISRN